MAHVQYWFVRDARRFIRTTSAKFTSALARIGKFSPRRFLRRCRPTRSNWSALAIKHIKRINRNQIIRENVTPARPNGMTFAFLFVFTAARTLKSIRRVRVMLIIWRISLYCMCVIMPAKKHTNNAKYGSTLEIFDPRVFQAFSLFFRAHRDT